MRYTISHSEHTYLECLKSHMPAMMGIELKRITKTSKFEETYASRAFKNPVLIKKLHNYSELSFCVTFRQFLTIEHGEITYTPTPDDSINKMIDDAILRFRLFKSFVYKDYKTGLVVPTAGFDTLKFDLILHIHAELDYFKIEGLQIKSYYGLMCNEPKRFFIYIKDREFTNNLYFEVRYTGNGTLVESSSLPKFIKTVEAIWECEFNLNNLDINGMKTTTEMLLI